MVDNEGLKDGIVDDEGLLAESGLAKLFIMNVITTVIKITDHWSGQKTPF